MSIRIIPRLDIKGPNLVKGIHFEGLRVLGKPEWFARRYYEEGADELLYMDAVASLYGRNSLLDIVEKTARELFIPLTVGGGLRTLEDIRHVLRAGADKVAINTAAVNRPDLIREAVRAFGSSTVVVSIEAIQAASHRYEICVDYGRQRVERDAVEWAVQAVELGAGELMVTSVDREGTGKGFDVELIRSIAERVPVPVIAGGGAGCWEHVVQAIEEGCANAVSLASVLHYHLIQDIKIDPSEYAVEGNLEFIQGRRGGSGSSRIHGVAIAGIKEHLRQRQVLCRPVETGGRA